MRENKKSIVDLSPTTAHEVEVGPQNRRNVHTLSSGSSRLVVATAECCPLNFYHGNTPKFENVQGKVKD